MSAGAGTAEPGVADALCPRDEADLAGIVAGARGPLVPVGGGTRAPWYPAGTRLSLARLSGVRLYEPGALTLVVGAGTPMAEIEALLAGEGQRLAFEPPDLRGLLGREGISTIGGIAAANASGPRRVLAGACRDHMLGIRFVDGSGRVLRNGGRVMKNVTGYDLVKLLAGSHGTLGILTELALKVLPVPEMSATLRLRGLDDASAIRAMTAALGSPYEVTAAAHCRGEGTCLRLEGFAEQVSYRARKLAAALAPFGEAELETAPEQVAALWRGLRDVAPLAARPGDVWRLSLRATEAAALVARAGAPDVLYDWGGGLVWLLTEPGTDLRSVLGPFAGHATLVRAAAPTRERLPAFHPEPAPVAALSAGLRARFDPRRILNPGLMG